MLHLSDFESRCLMWSQSVREREVQSLWESVAWCNVGSQTECLTSSTFGVNLMSKHKKSHQLLTLMWTTELAWCYCALITNSHKSKIIKHIADVGSEAARHGTLVSAPRGTLRPKYEWVGWVWALAYNRASQGWGTRDVYDIMATKQSQHNHSGCFPKMSASETFERFLFWIKDTKLNII